MPIPPPTVLILKPREYLILRKKFGTSFKTACVDIRRNISLNLFLSQIVLFTQETSFPVDGSRPSPLVTRSRRPGRNDAVTPRGPTKRRRRLFRSKTYFWWIPFSGAKLGILNFNNMSRCMRMYHPDVITPRCNLSGRRGRARLHFVSRLSRRSVHRRGRARRRVLAGRRYRFPRR